MTDNREDDDRRDEWTLFKGSDMGHSNMDEPDDELAAEDGYSSDDSRADDEDDGDDADPDFFEGEGPQPKQKPPRYSKEDPRYWEAEESPFEHLKPTRPVRMWIWMGSFVVFLVLLCVLFNALFGVKSANVVKYGYLVSAQENGKYIRTYEMTMIPYLHKSFSNTPEALENDTLLRFSTPDKALYDNLVAFRDSVKPVKVVYKIYKNKMPWRGETTSVLTAVEEAKPSEIYPPEFVRRLKPRDSEPKDILKKQ